MDFKPYDVESICYQLRYSDWGRSSNRALVNQLFDGWAPYTADEVRDNDINANFNDLTSTRKAHDARGQMYQAILKPGNYFRATCDLGPRHSRQQNCEIVTRNMNRVMKKNLGYYELQRSKIAQSILHGIGTAAWPNGDSWRPKAVSIEDVLIPSGEASELPMENLPLFAIHKSLTGPELIKLTRGPNRDKGWNMEMVEECLKWIDQETKSLLGNNWPLAWSPEKQVERLKEGGAYWGDSVPMIEVYDFYFWDEWTENGGTRSGWKRRMILDVWGTPSSAGGNISMARKVGSLYERSKDKEQFLYDGGDRVVAGSKNELVSFQFADLSAVAPFRYHTVRGLGFLLHDVCHIQNRLTCKITESTFETLTMLMRVKSQEDIQRALKANLFNRGFVDETVQFIPQAERWQVNTGLVEFGSGWNERLINESSSTHSQNTDMSKGVEKGQLQIMAELNATTAMLSAGLLQYYQYQVFEYREILRRFFNRKADCQDVEVKKFQADCLRDGVPEVMLDNYEAWEVEPERVLGAGNKTLEMAISQQLLAMIKMYDPDSQRKILRDVTSAVTDDPARAKILVPDEPRVSDTVHDTELVFNALMAGNPITPKSGLNNVEAASTTIKMMNGKVQQIMRSGGVGTAADVNGLALAAGYAAHFIKEMEEDKGTEKVGKKLNEELTKLGKAIKGMMQKQQQAAQQAQQQNGNGGLKPEDAAKIQATIITAKTKAQLASQSHAERTAQRQISFEQKLKQDKAKHELEMHKQVTEHGAEMHKKDLEGAANINRSRMKSFEE